MEEGYAEVLKPNGIFSGIIEDYMNRNTAARKQLRKEYPSFRILTHAISYLRRRDELYNSEVKELKDMINSHDGVTLFRRCGVDILEISAANFKEREELIGDISEKFEKTTGKRLLLDLCF